MKFADLHLHSIFSDGTYTPQELIDEAQKVNLSCISVVDHDTVSAIAPLLELSATRDVEVLPGLELTAEYHGLEIHILGYLIDYKNKELLERISVLQQSRIERIYKIIDKLREAGVVLKPETVFNLARFGTVGRLHVARAMVEEGLVHSTAEAFRKYIGDGCPAYVLGFKLSPQEAIPVLAHPYTVAEADTLYKMIDYGIMGLEVYYPEHASQLVDFYLNIAEKHRLLVTGGSDCHGLAKASIRIGSVRIPYGLVEKLKETKEKLYE